MCALQYTVQSLVLTKTLEQCCYVEQTDSDTAEMGVILPRQVFHPPIEVAWQTVPASVLGLHHDGGLQGED